MKLLKDLTQEEMNDLVDKDMPNLDVNAQKFITLCRGYITSEEYEIYRTEVMSRELP